MAQKKRKGQSGKGALLCIMLLFLASGIVRFTGQTGQAFAREDNGMAESTEPVNSAQTVDFSAAIEALNAREAKVAKTEERLEKRLEILASAEAQFKASRQALVDAEENLAKTIAQAETAMENDVAQLATVYEKMKPKDAAALFAKMDPEFAAGFLGRMKTDIAAAILSGLQPEQAYTISVLLAGRNGKVPTK